MKIDWGKVVNAVAAIAIAAGAFLAGQDRTATLEDAAASAAATARADTIEIVRSVVKDEIAPLRLQVAALARRTGLLEDVTYASPLPDDVTPAAQPGSWARAREK